ncbi:class II myosin [Sorochytrium milnesiophthora]
MMQIGKRQQAAAPAPVAKSTGWKKADWNQDRKPNRVDMTLLSKISEQTINENLEKRFHAGEIYTYIGHVLISVNPFKDLGIYTDDILRSYIGKNLIEMPPHVFAIAESAYYRMKGYKENQCVIISGESGAGKTEAAKKIMQYIANVSTDGGRGDSAIQQVKDMVLATNPLLESFGNAKTLRNNNSSRFGKYLEIQFNDHGLPVGANIINYLLEKGRVVSQIQNERNFHIFYQFCQGASEEYRNAYGIGTPDNYVLTCQSGCMTVDGIDDLSEYKDVLHAMNVIGITAQEQSDIHRLLAAILWAGNITFTASQENSEDAVIQERDALDTVAYLLGVPAEALEKSIISKVVETYRGGRRSTRYEVPLNVVQAHAVRDALAKVLYERMFDWIVQRVNAAMRSRQPPALTIGVLDIYGFEIFDHNSFEQLCINYVNEKLQQIFIELTLKTEQEEYVSEGIQWTPIEYFNNKIVCDLIEERRPPGVLSIMNDACATAHADTEAADRSLGQRLSSIASHPHFHNRGTAFTICHYAGDVSYEINGMTEKNKDAMNKDLLELIKLSENGYLQSLFPEDVDRENKKRPPTAGDKIKNSAGDLVSTLMGCQPSYIRCIKPNANKSPKEYDEKMSLHQVKYLGLLENVRVRRAGFASRQSYERFLGRFYMLSSKTCYAGECTWTGDPKKGAQTILQDTGIGKEEWQLGKTKAFIKRPETLFELEAMRDQYWHRMATRIQRAWRRHLIYRNKCATAIQTAWRNYKGLNVYVQMRDYGHQVLAGRKERRRFSLISMRRFMGDYLDVAGSAGAHLRAVASLSSSELIIFSDKIQVVVTRLLRSSKLSPRILVMTDKAVYIIVTKLEGKVAVQKLESKIPLAQLSGMSMSPNQDDFLVLHVSGDDDVPLTTNFKTELAAYIVHQSNNRVRLTIEPETRWTDKHDKKKGTLKFLKDETLKNFKFSKDKVSIATGQPASSVSNPPAKRLPRPPKSTTSGATRRPANTNANGKRATPRAAQPAAAAVQPSASARSPPPGDTAPLRAPPRAPVPSPPPRVTKPMFRALYAFNAQAEGELVLTQGETVEVVTKEDSGWWLAKSAAGTEGWVPSNYLEEIKEQARPVPPAAPPRRPVSQMQSSMSEPRSLASLANNSSTTSSQPNLATGSAGNLTSNPNQASTTSVASANSSTLGSLSDMRVATPLAGMTAQAAGGEDNIPQWKKELMARKAGQAVRASMAFPWVEQ